MRFYEIYGADRRSPVRTFSDVLFLVMFSVCMGCTSLVASTVVAARNSDEVVLAADSKLTHFDDRQRVDVKCKIFSCGAFFVGMTGPEGVNDVVDFRPQLLLKEACRTGKTSEAMKRRFEQILRPRYTRFLAGLKRVNPEFYAYGVQSQQFFVNLVMVGFENGMPFIRSVNFYSPLDGSAEFLARVETSSQIRNLELGDIDYVTAGVDGDIKEWARTQKSLWRLGLVEAARFLVLHQMMAKSDIVGPPIDILRITKDGARWIQRKPECEEKKASRPIEKPLSRH